VEIVQLEGFSAQGWAQPAVAVGNFDGVHRGHQALVGEMVAAGRRGAGTTVVLTFEPHPSRILAPDRAPSALMTVEQKAEVLAGLDVDKLAVVPFTHALASQGPREFAERVLTGALGAATVVVGSAFRFGHRRAGDLEALRGLGEELGFRVLGVPPTIHDGAPISSSRIREALARGDSVAARQMLGRPFHVDGTVVVGARRGRQLGFPTANVVPVNETLPGTGVYVVRCRPAGAPRSWGGVANVGRRPTFGGQELGLEAHLFDFEGDLYGSRLRVEFLERLREERAFSGAEALVAQIERDVAEARRVLEKA